MEKNSRKGKQSNKYVKNIIGLKKLKLYKREKGKKKKRKKKENRGRKGKPQRIAKAQYRGRGL